MDDSVVDLLQSSSHFPINHITVAWASPASMLSFVRQTEMKVCKRRMYVDLSRPLLDYCSQQVSARHDPDESSILRYW